MGNKNGKNGNAPKGGIEDQTSVRKRAAYIKAVADSPDNVALALKKAGLPISLAKEAEVWDETVLVRRQIREALDQANLNADFIADKLKFHSDSPNPFISLRAVNMIAKLRGYYDPIPKSIPAPSNLDPLAAELRKRDRIVEVIGLRSYPLPEEDRSPKGVEEPQAPHPGIGAHRGVVEAGTPPDDPEGGAPEASSDDRLAIPPESSAEFEGEVGGEEA
jgi:hypothetical protein